MQELEINAEGPVVERRPSERLKTFLVPTIVGVFAHAAWTYSIYVGVNPTKLRCALDKCYDGLGENMRQAVRFWRT